MCIHQVLIFFAKVALFVKQLPYTDHSKWLPHIMETLHAVMDITLKGRAESSKARTLNMYHLEFVYETPG